MRYRGLVPVLATVLLWAPVTAARRGRPRGRHGRRLGDLDRVLADGAERPAGCEAIRLR